MNRFFSELSKMAYGFEKTLTLRKKSAAEIRSEAQKIYTTQQFEAFKQKYSRTDYQLAYAIKVASLVEQKLSCDIESKKDLFSEIINEQNKGLNKALDTFSPDKLCCKICGKSSEIIFSDGTESEEGYYEKEHKRFHKKDDGELVFKSLNSWVIDHIKFSIKNSIDREAIKRSQFKEYACPHCNEFVLEKTRKEDEILHCVCKTEFTKIETRKRPSFYNTKMLYLSQPINDEDETTLDSMIASIDTDLEEVDSRNRIIKVVEQIKNVIATQWEKRESGIFKDPKKEAEMFDLFVPDIFYSEHDERIKKIKTEKAMGLTIAEAAGYTFPYAVCLDCGRKILFNSKWEERFETLQKQGCPSRDIAIEHQENWTDGVYNKVQAEKSPVFAYRIGYERALFSGSNNNEISEFVDNKKCCKEVDNNYEARRISGLNLELRSCENGFSNIGEANNISLPDNYKGEKERITKYMHQVANRWIGKLRKDCPQCRAELEELERYAGRGKMECPVCGYKWNLREGEFLTKIKTDSYTKDLYNQYMSLAHEFLITRIKMQNRNA